MSDNRKEVIATGSTKDEAIISGAQELGRSADEVDFTVVDSGNQGFLGFFQKPWKVKVKPREQHKTLKDATIEEALKAAESVDGSFHLEVENRNVMLTVHPPEGHGDSVEAEEVIAHLNQVGLNFCDFDKVRSVVNNESGESVQIGQLPPGVDIDTDYEVQISEDGLTAELILRPPRLGGDPPEMSEVERILNELKISEGVKWNVIEDLVRNRRYNERRVIAEGRPPERGDDAEIKYYFDTKNKPNFANTEGKIDFREMGLINNVEEGELLAEKRDPTPGRNGLTVQGESIDAPEGEDVELQYGANVRKEDNSLYSEISGQVILENGSVSVYDVYTVEGDVDYSTGNIVFDGTVIVEGSVKDRFKIKATGDIIVEEGVEKAYLQSEQNIMIQAGVRGKGHAQINAGGSIVADFIEQAGLIAQRNVLVSEMIMHSRIDAGEGVYVTGSRGLIAGGEVRAGKEVYANEIGSIGASDTNIEVGIDPKFFRSVAKIEEKISEEREKLDKVQRAINTMSSKDERTEAEDKKYAKLQDTLETLERNIENHREEQKNLARRADEREGALVMVEGTIFGGTRIGIGNDIYRVRSGKKEHCGFRKIEDTIQQVTFEKPVVPSV